MSSTPDYSSKRKRNDFKFTERTYIQKHGRKSKLTFYQINKSYKNTQDFTEGDISSLIRVQSE